MFKYYAVAVGRKPGIYLSKKIFVEQINNFPGAKYITVTSMAAAERYMNRTFFFAVKKGRRTGLFFNSQDFLEQISNFSKPEYEVFENLVEAEKYLSVEPPVKTLKKGFKKASTNFATDNEFSKEKEEEEFFVVARGKKTGIFKTLKECNESRRGVPYAVSKKFKNKDAAIAFLNQELDPVFYVVLAGSQSRVYDNYNEYADALQNFPNAIGKAFDCYNHAKKYFLYSPMPGRYVETEDMKKAIFSKKEYQEIKEMYPTFKETKFSNLFTLYELMYSKESNDYYFNVELGGIERTFDNEFDAVVSTLGNPHANWVKMKTLSLKNKESIQNSVELQLEKTKSVSSEPETIVAYTDGSFNPNAPKRYGYGIVWVKNNEVVGEDCSYGVKLHKFQNFTAEFVAIVRSLEIAVHMGYKKICIFHDITISDAYNILWSKKKKHDQRKPLYEFLINELKKFESRIEIEFVQIKGHNGNPYNQRADKLSKLGNTCKKIERRFSEAL